MRITRLQIERFRSIRSLDFQVPQVCAFVGPNNAGKSNILEAIKRVLLADYGPRTSTFSEEDVHQRNEDENIEICLTFGPAFEYRKIQKADPVSIERLRFCWSRYQRGEKKGLRRLEQECLKPDGEVPTVQTSYGKPGQRPNFEQVIGIPQEIRDQIPFIYIGTDRSLREQLPNARWSMLRRIFEDIDRGLRSPAEQVEVRSEAGIERVQRADRFRQLIREAMDLLRTGEFNEIEAAIKKHALDHLGLDCNEDAIDLFFSPMDSMEFYKSLVLIVKEGDFEISASEMGEGMQNAIVLAILRAFEETRRKGAIILIEEPEMFLHPQMQRSLYSTLERLGETNQVIYTTHSPHFVSVPEFRNVALIRKDGELGTNITQSDLKVDAAKLERLRQMFASGTAELFFANRVLIVEGSTEMLVVPVFAERHRVDLDSAGGTVIDVGGKRALLDYAELAISFGITTGVVYDRDKADDEFNAELDALARSGATIWCLDPDYEGAAKATVGEDKYREIMDRYPPSVYGISKARRGRMAATDPEMQAPPALLEAIRWLGNVKEKPAAPKPVEPNRGEWGVTGSNGLAAPDGWTDEWVDRG